MTLVHASALSIEKIIVLVVVLVLESKGLWRLQVNYNICHICCYRDTQYAFKKHKIN